MSWIPQRTLAETDAILCAPGNPHELESCVVDGRLQRVYKNLWPSLRVLWLWAANEHADATYVVFEHQRCTFQQILQSSLKAAFIFQEVYGITKGDRVAICSRNYPEYLAAFWACHLIGAVSVLVNAWLPLDPLRHCLTHTQCKLIIVDAERADQIALITKRLATEAGTKGFIVIGLPQGSRGSWKSMEVWDTLLSGYSKGARYILEHDPGILPDDNATILFTSGTTGLPKGVLSTHRQFLTNIHNVSVAGRRAILRRGEDIPPPVEGPQKGILVSVPLFHVTGLTSLAMLSTVTGMKIIFMRKWHGEEAARLIKQENIAVAGGVPSMVMDLIESSSAGHPLDSLLFGGAPAPDSLASRAKKAFPTAAMSQGYGLTETNSVAVGVAGEDYLARPTSCGLPTPVNDLVITHGETAVPHGTVGEVWIRGPNIMKEYWGDPAATDKALTKDGWLKTGDLGVLDKEGFLYIRDRIKDVIIRGGENIDSVSVENALYADDRVLEAAAIGVPDAKLGELVAAVVSIKPAYGGQVTEASLVSLARKRLPKFAVPVMILIQSEPFERTPSGKILKADLRSLAKDAWNKKLAQAVTKL